MIIIIEKAQTKIERPKQKNNSFSLVVNTCYVSLGKALCLHQLSCGEQNFWM